MDDDFFSQDVDRFVLEMASEETQREKCQKLQALQLAEDEWARVYLLLGLLAKANVVFLGKDSSELNNDSPDNVSLPPRMEDYKLGKTSSSSQYNKQK
jgi:hypothetical protein